MGYVVHITRSAQDDLAYLGKRTAARIIDKLDFFASADTPLHFAKKLKNFECGSYRFRIGDYRAIFDVDSRGAIHILMILQIQHRKDVYKI